MRRSVSTVPDPTAYDMLLAAAGAAGAAAAIAVPAAGCCMRLLFKSCLVNFAR